MKTKFLGIFILSAVLVSSCEKDQSVLPVQERQTIKDSDAQILCNRCGGDWDINGSDSSTEEAGFRIIESDTTSAISLPKKPANQRNKNY